MLSRITVKKTESDQRDAEHSVYYDGDEVNMKHCKYITAQYHYGQHFNDRYNNKMIWSDC